MDGDENLKHFNASHFEKWQIPALKEIKNISVAAGVDVKLLGSPWSVPAWMKDSRAWGHGRLRDDSYALYARYLVKVAEYFAAEHLSLWALTLQNEPRFEPGSYPGTKFTAHNESSLAAILTPMMRNFTGINTRISATIN